MRAFQLIVGVVGLIVSLVHGISVDDNSLQANGLTTPLGLQTTTPRLSWIPLSSRRNDKQTAYQLQASSESSFSTIDLWDTGKVASSDFSVVYGGKTLGSRDRAYWRVRSWDAAGDASSWSEATWFEMGLMNQGDWQAQWITNTQFTLGNNSLPMFVKEFNATCEPSKARLYLLGLGVQWPTINGKAISDRVLDPSNSEANKTYFYTTYDVTDSIDSGANVLGVELGGGIYDSSPGLDSRYAKFTAEGYPLPLKLISQLEYECANSSSRHSVLSDSTWQTTTSGPHLEESWYGGFEYDARLAQPSAFLPAGNRSDWISANLTTEPYANLTPALLSPEMPPLRIVEEFPAVYVTKYGNTTWIFDFGQNVAGWYNFTFAGTRGQRITIYPGERLKSTGVDQSTTGSPIFDAYTFATNGKESYEPRLLYHGFRYLQVSGLTTAPIVGDMIGKRIRSDAAKTGSFESSNTLFNEIHKLVDQAIQNNFYSILTDCPHREKTGWLDQDHMSIDPVFFGYDLRGYGRHVMKEIRDSQNPDTGLVPTTAPEFTIYGSWPPYGSAYDEEPNWGISLILFALKHYYTYGDIEILTQNYEKMKKYISYLDSQNATSHILSLGLGDWEAPDATTPWNLTSTAGFAQGVEGLIAVAGILNQTDDVATYTTLRQEILTAYNNAFLNTSTPGITTYGSGSQCSDAMSLYIGAVPANLTEEVYAHLISTIQANGTHLSVGETCLEPFFRMLAGYKPVGKNTTTSTSTTTTALTGNELLYNIMAQTSYPSYGFQVVTGATSLTEHWMGMAEPAKTAGSMDHFMLAFGDWWLYGLSGMRQAEGSVEGSSAGWKEIVFEPVLVGDLTYVNATFQSVRGEVAAAWTLGGNGTLTYTVGVPVGSTGTVVLPYALAKVKLDGQQVAGHADVIAVNGTSSSSCEIRIGSGMYVFSAGS
jgi:hypothetical protein